MKNSGLHDGHRQRLKNKFLENGFQGFEPHNILEMLLFYSIPRKDTNEIAHNLINRFGSLNAVFDASFEELITVDCITENSATLIKMIPKLAREYLKNSNNVQTVYNNAETIGEFFVNTFIGEKNEVVYAMLLNNRFELLSLAKIHEGSVNSAQISVRNIFDAVLRYNASIVVIAHNHPDGTVCPSMDDIETTAFLMTSLNTIDVTLIEHFIVSGNEYCPVIHNTSSLKNLCKSNKVLCSKNVDIN